MNTETKSFTRPEITRDLRYRWTYFCDSLRQMIRRWMHRLQKRQEQKVCWPRWQEKAGSNLKLKAQSLSTCIITMNSADRIRPLLEYIRPWSDEIVVGVDSKTTDNTFEVCRDLADELFWIDNQAQTCNGGLEALVSYCHSDWVLRLDDDEFPEPEFTALKEGILSQEDYTHYKLPRLHICAVDSREQSLSWIDDGYLYPDFQMRLFRNQKDLLHFPGAVGHTSIQCDGPRGKISGINLVHLNLAINPRWKREQKLKTYVERLNGGWVHPVNEHALMFEDYHYQIKSYLGGDAAFRKRLIETVEGQVAAYENSRH